MRLPTMKRLLQSSTAPLLCGLACRLLYLLLVPQRMPENDDAFYWGTARALAQGIGYVYHGQPATDWMPGFPLFLTPWVWLFRENLFACRLVIVALSVATIPLAGRVATEWFGARVGRLFSWVIALFPPFWFYSVSILSETQAIFLVLAMLAMAARLRRGFAWRSTIGLGLCYGAALYTKPELVLLGPAYVLVSWLRPHALPRRAAIIMVVVGATTLAPWTLRNYHLFGEFIPLKASAGITLWWASHHPPIVELDRNDPELLDAQKRLNVAGKPGQTSKNFSHEAMQRILAAPHLYLKDCITDRAFRLFVGSQTEASTVLSPTYGQLFRRGWYFRLAIKCLLLLVQCTFVVLGYLGLFLSRKDNDERAVARAHLLTNTAVYIVVLGVSRYAMVLLPILIPHAIAIVCDLWPKQKT